MSWFEFLVAAVVVAVVLIVFAGLSEPEKAALMRDYREGLRHGRLDGKSGDSRD